MAKIIQFRGKRKEEDCTGLFLVCNNCGSHGSFGVVIDVAANVEQLVCESDTCNGEGCYRVDGGVIT